jgi:hypothetical protein
MNLRGSHLLYLVIIIFINYILYKNNAYIVFYIAEYILIFIRGIAFIPYNRDNLDFRIYNNSEDARIDIDNWVRCKSDTKSWAKTNWGHKSFNYLKALKYSGDIFYIISFLPIVPILGLKHLIKYLDNHLTIKA